MPAPRSRLGSAFEALEDRSLPSVFGVPWADPGHLTLSFVPDGTATPTGPSNLFQTMSSAGKTSAWESEILRAFQTWAVNANINIGLVADGGQPLGTVGAVQGDPRFGDVRISAAPIVSEEAAEATPFSWTGTTYSGDVTFSSALSFGIGDSASAFDVYTVALHEAGHVFGLDHSTAPDSAMHGDYGYRTGLGAGDIANLQALYGARTPDKYEGTKGNNTIATAVNLPGAAPIANLYAADADLTTNGEVDFFKFNASSTSATVSLQVQGSSLLEARVSVYSQTGQLVATGAATDPFNNNVTLHLSGLKGGGYYVKVESATSDVFGVGAYHLAVQTAALNVPPPPKAPSITDGHTNDVLGKATDLTNLQNQNLDARFNVVYRGAIEDATDTDFYKIQAPQVASGATENLNVIAWRTDGTVDPRVHVYDAHGKPVAFDVLANADGVMSVVVPNVTAGANYFVQVSAGTAGQTGGYFLGVDFNGLALPPVQEIDNGQLDPTATTATNTLTVTGGLYQFSLYAEPLATGAGAVTLTITDSAGNEVFVLNAASGDPAVTGAAYLLDGTYTLTYTYGAVNGQTAAPIRYHLALLALSDGVGTYAPTLPPTNTTPTNTTTTNTAPTTTLTAPATNLWLGKWYFF
jgi:hypothetical protein